MPKKYCPVCGNSLNPRIHFNINEFGKFSKEIAKAQKKLLKEVLRSIYMECPNMSEFHGKSLLDLLDPIQKELDDTSRSR